MKRLYSVFLFVLTTACQAQTDTTTLLKEATTKLNYGIATAFTILTSPPYTILHPQTSFRNLVRQYATADVLSIATKEEPGKKIIVTGIILGKDSKPVADALVYLYQTDARGWYAADAPHVLMNEGDMRHARLFGYVKTDKQGRFELHTIKPSGYPRSDLPAHIHIHIESKGYRSYISELLFDDDERLTAEIRKRFVMEGNSVAKLEAVKAPFVQQFNYVLQLAN